MQINSISGKKKFLNKTDSHKMEPKVVQGQMVVQVSACICVLILLSVFFFLSFSGLATGD